MPESGSHKSKIQGGRQPEDVETEIEKNEEKIKAGGKERPASHLGILLEKEEGVEGPQYIVGRSYPPANGTPELRKVGKFHSKGLKTSFQQSLRRSKHGGGQDPPASTGWAGRAARCPPEQGNRQLRARGAGASPARLPSDRSGFLLGGRGTGQPCRRGAGARGCGSRDRICPGPVRARH